MIVMIDSLAERYSMLPTEVINRATTFDAFVLTTALGYRNELQEKANNPNYKPKVKEPSQEEMMAMIERVRKKQGVSDVN
jgi:hypothetical protein